MRVIHVGIAAADMEGAVGFPVRQSQSAGLPRRTKTGKELGGCYARTSVGFLVHKDPLRFDETPIEDFIKSALQKLRTKEFLKLSEYSCTIRMLIGVFSDENVMFDLDIESIQVLSELGIGVRYDFYGGD